MKHPVKTLGCLSILSTRVLGKMTFPDCVGGPEILTTNLVCDTSASPSERAAALIGAWNITEKLANLVDKSLGAPRLGLDAYDWWNEALHGVGWSPGVAFAPSGEFSHATSFASPILLSAAFDDDLVHAVADAISTEARAYSNSGHAGLDYWTPNINPYKDPRWGRGSETPGEDPFRIKGYVKALIDGLQGKENITKVISTCKHYAAYDLEYWGGVKRYEFDAIVGMQDLVEYYLPPFQQCARDSKVKSIMCSYNSVNGTPACASTYLMGTVLRDFWEWNDESQYITSDCNAILNFHEDHNYTTTAAQSAAVSLMSGTDSICEVGSNTDVIGAWNQTLLPEEVIDQALRRMYEGLIRAGFFDPADATPYRSLSWKDVNTPEHQTLALRSAAESIVLKKNDGILPLKVDNTTTIALIGFWSDGLSLAMLGGYSGLPPYIRGPVQAAQNLGFRIVNATGPIKQNTSDTDTWTEAALEAANQSDIVIYFGGNDMTIEAEELDRFSIAWPSAQLALIEKLSKLGKPFIVVELGDQNDDSSLLDDDNVSAILWAGFPGQDGGTAIFDILTGKTAPAGRLTTTLYPAKYVDQVPMTDMSLRPSETNPGRTYKWYDNAVLPFGFGLHYTTFKPSFGPDAFADKIYDITELLDACNAKYLDLCPFETVGISVENTGNVTSDFVALAFLSGEYGPAPHPIKELAAYARINDVNPGETKEAKLGLTLGDLARVDEKGNTILYPGTYSFLLDVPTQATIGFELTGEPEMLIEFPQPPADLGEGNGHEKYTPK
ncbi:glycoside hydrolase family 3 protein [Annulohypoxylon maeteangense]|uniref:glycoside hydrolase family 3 protein n=1 Tax=Annulohypoxylon maeteangense TaxID=1927788 RepID=UPI0020077246|nr:glycoside hydrolase family 3 protein [Annulohypoxylon maeteangense]KAI0881476.1 glycoside hydrolase family 3 protein [Annulohypoxylon maeteangense]